MGAMLMLAQLRPALVLFTILTLITGVIYPLAITGIAQVAFADKANGSIITDAAGKPIGSTLIGQEFAPRTSDTAAQHAAWFWGRPSATAPVPYTALNLSTGTGSSGSNLAPTNPALLDNIKARLAGLDAADASVGIVRVPPGSTSRTTAVPVDLVTRLRQRPGPSHLTRRGGVPGPPHRQGPQHDRGRSARPRPPTHPRPCSRHAR